MMEAEQVIGVGLTESQIRALLWHVMVIDSAYGLGHPSDKETYSAYRVLLEAIKQ